ncbi:MAG: tetratricopeptide repeat-containing sensor histidine kinase [Flavobacterium sp.]
MAIIEKDSFHLAKSLYYIGDYYDENNSLDEAYLYYSRSEKLYSILNDTLHIGKVKLKKAGILYDNGSYKECEVELINAIKLLSNKKAHRLVYECYNILALNLIELKEYPKSLEYFYLAQNELDKLDKSNSVNIKFSRSNCFNNIGNVYLKMKDYEKAQEFYKKAISIKDLKESKPSLYAMILSNLAYTKLKKGKSEEAKKMLLESYKIRDSLKLNLGIISSKNYLAQYYISQKDTLKAIENITYCYSLSKKIKSAPDVLNSLKLLTEIDTKNKNFYTNEYFRINDSLQQAERATRNKFARIEFETDQVEEENSILIKKNSYIIIGSFILFLFIGTLFILYRLKTKNKELKLIQDQQIKNEEIYQLLLKQQSISEESRKEERNRIAMELHDGVVNSVFTTRFNLMQLESKQTVEKDSIIKELEKTEAEIRRVAHELNLTLNFKDESILNMITNLVEAQKNEWNTQFVVKIDDFIDWNTIEVEIKMNAYRIIQEALQNVNKYSKAKQCIVMLLKTENKTTIRIWDNGIGFNPKKNKKGIGLKNIQERALTMKANLTINSKINNGTSIEIIF